jgi:hypothetical protein
MEYIWHDTAAVGSYPQGANLASQFNNGELFITQRASQKPGAAWNPLGFRCAVSDDPAAK